MILQIDINNIITSKLSSFIKANIQTLSTVEPSSFTKDDFDNQIISEDISCITDTKSRFTHFTRNNDYLLHEVKNILNATTITNSVIYAPNSCMLWHTNSDDPGTRIYYTYSNKLSIFRYIDKDTGQIVDDIDNVGWTARKFDITDESNPFWHTIWTSSLRFSFGFKL
jgi:hypothetical protein